MRKHVPGQGTHITSPVDPRLMVVAPAGTKGDYILLGRKRSTRTATAGAATTRAAATT
jgi:hypothetical protein